MRNVSSEKSNDIVHSWIGVFALDVPNIYLTDGVDEQGVPKKLPNHSFLRQHYLQAKAKGMGFNTYALARTLKSERGTLIGGGIGGTKWLDFAGQYKGIASCILCRLLGYGGMPVKEIKDENIFGKDLYAQTTGLVKLAVAGVHDWGPFSKSGNNRKGAAFATKTDVNPEDPFDADLIRVCEKILAGQWFIGDQIYGAVSFYHPNTSTYYNRTDVASVNTVTSFLNKESPMGKTTPPKSMGGKASCWIGSVDNVGTLPTQIRFYAKMPLKGKASLRNPPSNLPWANTIDGVVPIISDPPAFEYARKKNMLRPNYETQTFDSKKKDPIKSKDIEEVHIKPISDIETFKNAKNAPIPPEKGFYVMDGNLVEALRHVSTVDLALTTAVVKIFYFDKGSNVQKHLNIHMVNNGEFTKEALLETGGRPKLGLLGIDVAQQETCDSFVTDKVDLKFKIYDKSVFDVGGILVPFFYPEFPFGVEYGLKYNGDNPDSVIQKLLNFTELRMCNPTSYDISIDEKGIYDFTVHAVTGVNYAFNKMNVGSFAIEDSEKLYDDYGLAKKNLDAIKATIAQLEEEKQQNGITNKNIKNLNSKINNNEKSQKIASKELQDVLGQIISKKMSSLKAKCQKFPGLKTKKKGKKQDNMWVSVGNIIRELCKDDLQRALELYSTTNNIQTALVWSRFNKDAGDYSDKSIDEFLVPFADFRKQIQESADMLSQPAVRLDAVFNIILGYLNQESGYRITKKGKEYDNFTKPDVIHYIKHDIKPNGNKYSEGQEYVEYVIVDRHRGSDYTERITQMFDPRTEAKFEFQEEKATSESLVALLAQTLDEGFLQEEPQPLSRGEKKQLLKQSEVAYVQFLEANSFVKSIRMNAETDPNIVNIAIEKMHGYSSMLSDLDRENLPSEKYEAQGHYTKIRLPLKGSIELLGHPMWKPLKSFYMFTESEEWSGFYQILNATHSYSVGLPKTTIEVMYWLYQR